MDLGLSRSRFGMGSVMEWCLLATWKQDVSL